MPCGRSSRTTRARDVGEDLLRRLGHLLVAGVGGAGGSLYGTAFIEAGIAVAGLRVLDARGHGPGARGGGRRRRPARPLPARATRRSTTRCGRRPTPSPPRSRSGAGHATRARARRSAPRATGMRATTPAGRPPRPRAPARGAVARPPGPGRDLVLPAGALAARGRAARPMTARRAAAGLSEAELAGRSRRPSGRRTRSSRSTS